MGKTAKSYESTKADRMADRKGAPGGPNYHGKRKAK